MLHEDRAHLHAVLVFWIDDDGIHLWSRRLLARAVRDDAEIDVGRVAVAANADLVHAHGLGDVLAALVLDAEVDVVGERPEHVLERGAGAGGRLVGVHEGHFEVGRERRDWQARWRRAEDVDRRGAASSP